MIQKISYLLVAIFILTSCDKDPVGYSKISGKLENSTDSIITILGYNRYIKKIKLNADGTFNDTLKIKYPGIYTLQTHNNRAPIFMDNGFNLKLSGDVNEFLTSFKFKGKGSENSNYIVDQVKIGRSIPIPDSLFKLSQEDFDAKLVSLRKEYDALASNYQNLDTVLLKNSQSQTTDIITYLQGIYKENLRTGLGKPSPIFENYKNYAGGTSSLNDFKGKFVYIDLWATWCGPCIQQIPYLKELEKEYKDKNITFVSISVDDPSRSGGSWEAAEKKWKDFVKSKNLTGVQLWSGEDYAFQQAYSVNEIPRFILLDTEGKILAVHAPRPSDPALKTLLLSVGVK